MARDQSNEILHSIFIQLSLDQRLECTFVCRHWLRVLYRRSLLYSVDINSQHTFDNFIDMIYRHPSRGSQVEILIISDDIEEAFDNRRFCHMFPNLRVFKFDVLQLDNSKNDLMGKSFEPVNSNTKLEEIQEVGYSEFTQQVLRSGVCTRLRKLSLTFFFGLVEPGKAIFPCIQGKPVLKKLNLNACKIGIQDLELLHSKTPALESFELEDISLTIGELPGNIVPAISVTRFRIEIISIQDRENYFNWYRYMAKKYTSVNDFDCNDMEMQGVTSDEAMIIYRDGLIPIYRTLGKHLDTASVINIPHELDLFNQLDQFGCQIQRCLLDHNESIPIFTQLGQSNQAKYVETLHIKNTMVTVPSLLQNMTSLTVLTIDIFFNNAYWPINLNEYLNAFPPTLIDFSANCTDLEVTNVPTRSSNIKKLYLICPKLSKALGQVVSCCFPRLIDLNLEGRVQENIMFNLPTHHLQNVTFFTDYEKHLNGFLMKFTNNPQVKYHRDGEEPKEGTLEPETAEEFQNIAIVSIHCASARLLRLNSGEFNGMN